MSATLALLPRGRAWPVNDGAGVLARFLAWIDALAGAVPPRAAWPAGYVQTGFYAAIAAVRNFIETQVCALRLEFWCASQTLTRANWLREYGDSVGTLLNSSY